MKKMITVLLMVFSVNAVFSADSSEEGVPTAPLMIYSGGISAGSVKALNEELSDQKEMFLKLAIVNNFSFRDNVSLFLDFDYFLPENNFGGDLGFDLYLSDSDLRPFAGIGCGAHYIDRDGDFSENLGPSITAHAGLLVDLNENVSVRFRVPYHMILNEYRDHMVGLECAFIFSSKFKNVKKLRYN
jgi:hypothetical protein